MEDKTLLQMKLLGQHNFVVSINSNLFYEKGLLLHSNSIWDLKLYKLLGEDMGEEMTSEATQCHHSNSKLLPTLTLAQFS